MSGGGRRDAAALLEIRDLSVDFDGFKALDGVSLTVAEGDLRCLIGPNGAGKTTLIDVVTGLVRPTAGSVRYAGDDVTGAREHAIVRKGIGRSFQTPTVFESLTVVENLDLAESFRRRLPSLFRHRKGMSEGVEATSERIGLAAARDRPAGSLSHGQKQWLEIGMLLVQQPRLLLLDEPVAGMSPQERVDTGRLLQELAAERTVVVVEHDMAFVRRFASSVTVLHEGRVLSEGSVEEVQADPTVREVYLGRSRDARSGAVAVAGPGGADDGADPRPAAGRVHGAVHAGTGGGVAP
jgi:urea transport system ATP-binding protein